MGKPTKEEEEAIKCHTRGEEPSASSDIAGHLTLGYGNLDALGEWEYPLPKSHWPAWAMTYLLRDMFY